MFFLFGDTLIVKELGKFIVTSFIHLIQILSGLLTIFAVFSPCNSLLQNKSQV